MAFIWFQKNLMIEWDFLQRILWRCSFYWLLFLIWFQVRQGKDIKCLPNKLCQHKRFLSKISAAGAPMLLMLYQSSIGLFALQYVIGRIGSLFKVPINFEYFFQWFLHINWWDMIVKCQNGFEIYFGYKYDTVWSEKFSKITDSWTIWSILRFRSGQSLYIFQTNQVIYQNQVRFQSQTNMKAKRFIECCMRYKCSGITCSGMVTASKTD